jgi:hypothetical protein
MGRTSAGLHERDAGCGIVTRDRTTRRIKRKTLVHYLVSPPHCPATGRRQAKARHFKQPAEKPLPDAVNTDGLTRLEVASQGECSCAVLMSRARRFIPRSGIKSKIKICVLPGNVRKNCHRPFSINATNIKKGWK